MTATTLLATTSAGVRPLGVRGEPLHHSQTQIREVVRRRLGARHAALLSESQPHENGRVDWYADAEGPVRSLVDMPEAERVATRAVIDGLLADIAALGASLAAGGSDDARLAGQSIELAARSRIDADMFVVGDQPVVVRWGHEPDADGSAILPARPSFATPFATPSATPVATSAPATVTVVALVRRPFPWLVAMLGGLAAIALVIGLAWLLRPFIPVEPDAHVTRAPPPPAPPPSEPPPDPTITLRAELAVERSFEEPMRKALASLREEFAKRHAGCKPPEPPPAKPPEPPVVEKKPDPPKPPVKPPVVAEKKPDPPPTPKPAPPPTDDRMRLPTTPTRDLSFMQGCWRSDPFKHDPSRSATGVSEYCFDANGRGNFVFRRGAFTCRTGATGQFEGSMLRIRDGDTTCSDGTLWYQDRLDCTAGADGVAVCRGEAQDPSAPGGRVRWSVNLHRTR